MSGAPKLYGRKWRVRVFSPYYDPESGKENKENSTALDVSDLRCVFRATMMNGRPSLCQLEIYNLNAQTEGTILEEGFQICIEAGYEGQYGIIYEGDIIQVIRNRENSVNYKLEILALSGSIYLDSNYIRCNRSAGQSPRDVVNTLSKVSMNKIEVEKITDDLSKQKLPRGKVYFGEPKKYLRDIALGNNAYFRVEGRKLIVDKSSDEIPADKIIDLTPTTIKGKNGYDKQIHHGLVGTPQYGDDGIHIKMLLDSRVKPMYMVKIDNELVRRAKLSISPEGASNGINQQKVFDEDGEYQAYSVVHAGDTHGNDWYTEIVGISRHGRQQGGLLGTQVTGKETMQQ